ncbi:MAG TPA: porin family protein [Chitinophaga sp.]
MKKHYILLAALLSFGFCSFAQTKVTFGVKAGFSGANTNSKSVPPGGTEVKADTKFRPSFHAGVIVDFELSDYCSFQPGLFYSSKGSRIKTFGTDPNTGAQIPVTVSSHLNYLEMPLNLMYKAKVGKGKFFGGFGPYVAYGIGGKIKGKNEASGLTVEMDVKFKNQTTAATNVAYVKPLDLGINIPVGYELDMGLLFSANFSLGLTNTSPYQSETEKNYYLGLSVGYLFKKKK